MKLNLWLNGLNWPSGTVVGCVCRLGWYVYDMHVGGARVEWRATVYSMS